MKKSFSVETAFNDMRVDRWIRNNLGNIPQGLIEKNLRNGKIKLNNKKIKIFKTQNILSVINNKKFTNKKNTIGVIYVVRDPRNIVTSLQNHYEISKDEALNFMLNKNKFIYDY